MTVQYQGVWSLQNAAQLQSTQRWVTDPLFENTTLLLQADDAANGAQNNTFLDSSSNSFAITRNGNTTQGSFTPFSPVWSNYFDGTGDYLSIADNAAFEFGSGDFCVELFAYITNIDSDGTLFAGTWNTPNRGWVFGYIAASSELDFNFSTNGTNANPTKAVVSLPLNQWVHFAACRSGNTLSTYMNGARIATRDVTGVTIFAPNQALEIGRLAEGPSTWDVIGYISNFRIVKGSSVYNPTQTTINIPTTTLTAITNTTVLTCQSNRFIDSSTNALTVTPNGNVSVQSFSPFAPQYQWTPSVIGGSGYFDGTGDFLQAPSNAAFNLGTGDFTLECWVYATSTPSDVGIFESRSDGNTATTNGFTLTAFSSSVIRIYSGAVLISSSGTNYVNSWCHVAVTRVSGTFNLYINGVSQGTSGTARTLSNPEAIIGAGRYGGTSAVNAFFPGNIANFRIVKGQALTTGNFTPPTAPVTSTAVGWTGANVASSITGTVSLLLNFTNAAIYDGTMKNNLETVGNAQVSTAVVKYGSGSMFFDGTGDWCLAPNNLNFNFGSGDFTVEFWAYDTARSSNGTCWVSKWGSPASLGRSWIIVFITSTAKLDFAISTDGSNATTVISATYIPSLNTWNHYAITRSGNTYRLFVNGVLIGSGTNSGTLFAADEPLCVGANYEDVQGGVSNYNTIGYIDDLRITRGAARYTDNFIPPSVALPRQ